MRQAAYYKRRSFPYGTTRAALAAAVLVALVPGGSLSPAAAQPPAGGAPDIRLFFEAANPDDDAAEDALEQIAAAWRDGYAPIVRDMLRLLRPPAPPHRPSARWIPRAPSRRSSSRCAGSTRRPASGAA